MPKIDLNHFDPNKTHAIKVNVYKPEGISSFWNWFSSKNKNNATLNKLGLNCNLKFNLEEMDKLQMDNLIKKVQNLDPKQKKKLTNFGHVLNIKSSGLELTKNQILKEHLEKTPQMKKMKPLKPNFLCPYKRCVISSSSMSVLSRKGMVTTTNMKYRLIQTTKLNKSPGSSRTSLQAIKSSDKVTDLQPRPAKQNILLQSVPSTMRVVNMQRKIIKPVVKNKLLRQTKSQHNKLIPTHNVIENNNVTNNLLPMLITKIESMEEEINGIKNTTKQVVSDRKIGALKHTQSISVISHKIYSKISNQPRKSKILKPKKSKAKSKAVPKDQGFKLNYPQLPEFRFNSCSNTSNINNTSFNTLLNPDQYIQRNPQVLINKQEIKFPLHIPSNNLGLHDSSNNCGLLLNFFKTLSDIKKAENEIPSSSLPLVSEVEFQPINAQEIPSVGDECLDSSARISSDLNLEEEKQTESKENLALEKQESTGEFSESTMLKAEENLQLDQTGSLEIVAPTLTSTDADQDQNKPQETLKKSEITVEANSSRNIEENSEILREILNFTKLIISKLEVDPVKFPALSELKKDQDEHQSYKILENPHPTNSGTTSTDSGIVVEDIPASSSDQAICNLEEMTSSTFYQENNKLVESSDIIHFVENCCEVQTKFSKESVISMKSAAFHDEKGLTENETHNVAIHGEETQKDELKVDFEVSTEEKSEDVIKDYQRKNTNDDSNPSIGPQGDHLISPKEKTNKYNCYGSSLETLESNHFNHLSDHSLKNIYKSPKQNFFTKLETQESRPTVNNYSLESQGTYLNHEKRKSLEKHIKAIIDNGGGTKFVRPSLNSFAIRRNLSEVSNSIEPYEQFIETAIVSKQTSYSKTKFNICQENGFPPFSQPFCLHESSFPAVECVTSENKVDVTAKYMSKQHIIHHRKRDQSSYNNFESHDSFYAVSSRKLVPTFIDEDLSSTIQRRNKSCDVIDTRRRPCRFNLTLHQDRILEEKENHELNLIKGKHNDVQAEKGDCLIVQANYENQTDLFKSMNEMVDNVKAKESKVSQAFSSDCGDLKHSNVSEIGIVPTTTSIAVQTDLCLFKELVDEVRPFSSCEINEKDQLLTTQMEKKADLHQTQVSSCDLDIVSDKKSKHQIAEESKEVVEPEVWNNLEKICSDEEESEEDLLTIKIHKSNQIKISGQFITNNPTTKKTQNTVTYNEVCQKTENVLNDKKENEEYLLTIKTLKESNQRKSAVIQEKCDNVDSEPQIFAQVKEKENTFLSDLSLVLKLEENNRIPDQYSYNLPTTITHESNAILKDSGKPHLCSNPCLTTVSEETVKSNITELSLSSTSSEDSQI